MTLLVTSNHDRRLSQGQRQINALKIMFSDCIRSTAWHHVAMIDSATTPHAPLPPTHNPPPGDVAQAKKIAWTYFRSQNRGHFDDVGGKLENVAENVVLDVSHPINTLHGVEAAQAEFWQPLWQALSKFERRDFIFIGGHFNGDHWAAATGIFVGHFAQSWLNIRPTHKPVFLRFAEIVRVREGLVDQSYLILDIVDFARQAGIDLIPRGLGAELLPPAPCHVSGLLLDNDPASEESDRSLALVETMIAGLGQFDGQSLDSMTQTNWWDPAMSWYGPSGIGTALGLDGFQEFHQRPFLEFVPDRVGGNHYARFGDGLFVASGGWPSIHATTSGAPWISTPLPAGVKVTMRVMDFWRREGELLTENWVLIDIPDVFRQCGIDVFARLT